MRYVLLALLITAAVADEAMIYEEFQTWDKGTMKGYLREDGSLWLDREGRAKIALDFADIRSRRAIPEPVAAPLASVPASAARPAQPARTTLRDMGDEAARVLARYDEALEKAKADRDEALTLLARNAVAVAPAIPVPDRSNDPKASELRRISAAQQYNDALGHLRNLTQKQQARRVGRNGKVQYISLEGLGQMLIDLAANAEAAR